MPAEESGAILGLGLGWLGIGPLAPLSPCEGSGFFVAFGRDRGAAPDLSQP